MNSTVRRATWAGVTGVAVALAALAALAQGNNKNAGDGDSRRPKLSLKAQPNVSFSPSRVLLTAELAGGADDFEEFYCATVDWDWGDGTESESTLDCEPYQAGKSEIKRRFTIQRVFRTGVYNITFRLKRNNKTLAGANVTVRVQPGGQDGG